MDDLKEMIDESGMTKRWEDEELSQRQQKLFISESVDRI